MEKQATGNASGMLGSGTKKSTNIATYACIYLIGTLLLYAFGPYKWQTKNPALTYFLLISYMVVFFIGGRFAFTKGRKETVEGYSPWYSFFLYYYYAFAGISMVLSFISIQRIIQRYGLAGFTDLFDRLTGDYRSLYFATDTVESGAEMYGGSAFSLATAVLSPLTMLIIPFTIVAFKDLNFLKKVIGIIAIAMQALSSISKGSNYGIFIVLIPVFAALFIKMNRGWKIKTRAGKNTLIFIIAGVVVLYLFYAVMNDRMKGNVSFIQIGENTVDSNNKLLQYVPGELRKLLMWMEFYLCQGYYGFSCATEVGWEPMFGSGFSRWLCLELDSFMSVYENSYVVRIDEVFDWGASANWHTAYTWFANDVSLYGVIGLMLGLGYLFQRVYDHTRKTFNPFGLGLFSLLVQMILFIPCNNVVFSDSKTFIAFVVYLVGYLMTKNQVVAFNTATVSTPPPPPRLSLNYNIPALPCELALCR